LFGGVGGVYCCWSAYRSYSKKSPGLPAFSGDEETEHNSLTFTGRRKKKGDGEKKLALWAGSRDQRKK